MEIQELINRGANVSVTVETNDLKKFGDYLISQTKKELEDAVISDKAERYLTPGQVSEMLSVDLVTLWRWNKKSYLTHLEFGGGRRYRLSSVRTILNGGKAK
jgi:hypothetical protein